jgi:hypothetical protein
MLSNLALIIYYANKKKSLFLTLNLTEPLEPVSLRWLNIMTVVITRIMEPISTVRRVTLGKHSIRVHPRVWKATIGQK